MAIALSPGCCCGKCELPVCLGGADKDCVGPGKDANLYIQMSNLLKQNTDLLTAEQAEQDPCIVQNYPAWKPPVVGQPATPASNGYLLRFSSQETNEDDNEIEYTFIRHAGLAQPFGADIELIATRIEFPIPPLNPPDPNADPFAYKFIAKQLKVTKNGETRIYKRNGPPVEYGSLKLENQNEFLEKCVNCWFAPGIGPTFWRGPGFPFLGGTFACPGPPPTPQIGQRPALGTVFAAHRMFKAIPQPTMTGRLIYRDDNGNRFTITINGFAGGQDRWDDWFLTTGWSGNIPNAVGRPPIIIAPGSGIAGGVLFQNIANRAILFISWTPPFPPGVVAAICQASAQCDKVTWDAENGPATYTDLNSGGGIPTGFPVLSICGTNYRFTFEEQ